MTGTPNSAAAPVASAAAANRASREQIEELTIARMMRMRGDGPGSVRRYVKKTAKQRAEGSARHMASVEAAELCGTSSTTAVAAVHHKVPFGPLPSAVVARFEELVQ